MSGVAEWIMSILGVVIIGTILDIFLSEKKLGKLIRSVFGTLLVLVIITPVPSLIKMESCSLDFSGQTELDYGYLEYINKQKTEALEDSLAQALASEGYKNLKIEIKADFSNTIEIERVKIYFTNSGINFVKANTVKNLAAKLLNIDKEKITVYE